MPRHLFGQRGKIGRSSNTTRNMLTKDKVIGNEDQPARIVIQAATFLSRELAAHEREGACIDASGTLMRMLEREGIRRYMAGRATGVHFSGSLSAATAILFPFRAS